MNVMDEYTIFICFNINNYDKLLKYRNCLNIICLNIVGLI